MAKRRDQPALQTSGQTWQIRLPDGSVKQMPAEASRDAAPAHVCCFCGLDLGDSEPERVLVSARWAEDGEERSQSWGAHHRCLAERMHEAVAGAGPFFAG